MRIAACITAFALIGFWNPPTASAKSSKLYGYKLSAVWSAAIRMLRVDRKYPVEDKDKENGFILFTYPGNGAVKKCPASMEMFEVVDHYKRKMIRVQLHIAHQPSYVALHLLDKLQQKLLEERGRPRPERVEPKEKEKPKKPAKGKDKPTKAKPPAK